MKNNLIVILCLLFLAGCATTQKSTNSDLQGMSLRLQTLEESIKMRDQKIGEIEYDLAKVKQDCAQKTTTPTYSDRKESAPVASSTKIKTEISSNVIRVEGVTADQVQTALKNAGFYKGSIDGKLGPMTLEAIKSFQKENGLKVDGIIGSTTWASLKNNN